MAYCDTVGIDLGTTRSSVAVWDGRNVHVIANESGENTTPSWVTYLSQNSRRVGKAAERASSKYLAGTVYHSKRLIGRAFCPSLEEEKAALRWPFDIVDSDGNAGIRITVDGEEKVVSPEEVGAAVLSYLKKIAEDFIGRPVHKAVITVPAYFSDSQRQATRDAGLIAGLEVSRILNEPTAAALAFGVLDPLSQSNRKESALEDLLNPRSKDAGDKTPSVERAAQVGYGDEVCCTEGDIDAVGAGERGKRADKDAGEETGHGRNMLVFDFGGGTLDVTIMYIEHLTFKVRATDGDMTLGGEDIDATLVGHMLKVFKAKSGIDINEMDNEAKQSKAFKKMRDACAQAKIELSRESESELCIDDLVGGEGFETTLCREDMEEIIQPVLNRLRAPVERALLKVNGGMQARDVDQVLLVGGSSRIPKVQQMLQDMFPEAELCRRIHPDEAIVIGAAIEASRTIEMEDVVPRALCIATANHKDRSRSFATPVIPACTPIPPEGVAYTECFANSRDDQTCITLRLCEGEAEFFDDNLKLGVFEVSDIPPRPRGQVTIKVTLRVDTNGILSVHAKVDQTGQELDITVTSDKGRMSEQLLEDKKRENAMFQANKT